MRVRIKTINEKEKEVTLQYFGAFDLKTFLKNTHKGNMYGYLKPWIRDTTTQKQRGHFYALVGDIARYTGEPEWLIKMRMKYIYMITNDKTEEPSLADNAMKRSDARLLIQATIDYALEAEIPLYGDYLPYFEEKQFFKLTMDRKCWLCGKPADLHHQENLVGMGRDRRTVDHTESKYYTLCRGHHTEAHQIGLKTFEDKYHIKPISLTADNLSKLKKIKR